MLKPPNFILNAIVGLLLIISPFTAVAQSILIKGSVVDAATKQTIPGVSVMVKGSASGTMTDKNGHYEVSVPNNQPVLVFAFLGFAKQEIGVGSQRNIDVVLHGDDNQLNTLNGRVVGVQITKASGNIGASSNIQICRTDATES